MKESLPVDLKGGCQKCGGWSFMKKWGCVICVDSEHVSLYLFYLFTEPNFLCLNHNAVICVPRLNQMMLLQLWLSIYDLWHDAIGY